MKIAKERSRWRLRSHQFTKKTKSFLGFLLFIVAHILSLSAILPSSNERDLCYNEGYTKIHRKEDKPMTSVLLPEGELRVARCDMLDKLIAVGDGDAALLYLYILRHGGTDGSAAARACV